VPVVPQGNEGLALSERDVPARHDGDGDAELERTIRVDRNRRKGQRMNKTEERYAQHLLIAQRVGSVVWWGFEAVTLRLADQTRYTPDFAVLVPTENGFVRCEAHETKGFMREAARVRIRVAAAQYPWISFVVVRLVKGVWTYEPVAPGEIQPDPTIRRATLRLPEPRRGDAPRIAPSGTPGAQGSVPGRPLPDSPPGSPSAP
jgi:hypothetical protein